MKLQQQFSTYQPEEKKTVSTTTQLQLRPISWTCGSWMRAFNHKQLPLKKNRQLFGITSSGYRPGDSGDHGKGLAIDFMVPEAQNLGLRFAEYAIQNMASRGISYIIWKQRFTCSIR